MFLSIFVFLLSVCGIPEIIYANRLLDTITDFFDVVDASTRWLDVLKIVYTVVIVVTMATSFITMLTSIFATNKNLFRCYILAVWDFLMVLINCLLFFVFVYCLFELMNYEKRLHKAIHAYKSNVSTPSNLDLNLVCPKYCLHVSALSNKFVSLDGCLCSYVLMLRLDSIVHVALKRIIAVIVFQGVEYILIQFQLFNLISRIYYLEGSKEITKNEPSTQMISSP